MRVRKATTLKDAELVRNIRNTCWEWMTGHTRWISPAEQIAWWESEDKDLWIFNEVAYGLLTEREGKTWISLGILPEHRGKGLGTEIYRRFPGVYAEIRADNVASRRAAEQAGYELIADGEEVVVMRG